MPNLRVLPKIRDRISFLYFEHCRIEQEEQAIAIFQVQDKYLIPCASLSTLLLGPGSSITHAAVKTLADNGCTIHWMGEDSLRCYASGRAVAAKSDRLLHQVRLWADSLQRLAVVRRMYQFRFQEELSPDLTLQQIRGLEGVRVRTVYQNLSQATGVEWKGRDYKQEEWENNDPINKALSIANGCLYAVCQAALVSVGYSPALGFIHTGKALSFVYDIADLYKTETSIAAAFEAVSETYFDLESLVRRKCREKFSAQRLMPRLVREVDQLLQYEDPEAQAKPACFLWDDQVEWVTGGKNWSEEN
uniref:CRISPR-associated endonuclease Cas1 n=1 Tax=Cyanothece sp. (strain PCC 7425 / ATCC 29141) TaxID=395961 RepID=B8HWH6_CYAP4